MKHKNKVKRLEARIKDYERTIANLEAKNTGSSSGFKKPGSLNK